MQRRNIFNRIVVLSVAVLISILAWGGLIPQIALSQQVESRLNTLEADLNRIESRLNQLESQLNQLNNQGDLRKTRPSPPQISSGRNQKQLSREQMFDRLATLVVELREQIKQLQARVTKLESQVTPRKNP